MKYYILLILLLVYSSGTAQYNFWGYNIINENPFLSSHSPGTIPSSSNDFTYSGCVTFHTNLTNTPNPGTRPGLDISHGVPHFDPYRSDGHCLFMEDDATQDLGHGILIEAPFEANQEYIISFSLCCDIPGQGGITNLQNGILRFAIPNGKPANRNFTKCGDPIPSNSLFAVQDFTGTSFNRFFQQFTLTPTGNSNYLWIFPINTNPSLGKTSARLQYVAIQKKCTTGPCINLFANPIPAKTYTNRCINVGSSLNGYSPTLSTATSNQNTMLYGEESIEIVNNFVAQPNSGNYFLAEIRQNVCDIIDCVNSSNADPENPTIIEWCSEAGSHCAHILGNNKPAINSDQFDNSDNTSFNHSHASTVMSTNDVKKLNYTISIYPNPTPGSFIVQMPQSGNYTIRVMNLVGSTVYEGKMDGEQKKSIQLDQNLPPGNYTIHINGDGLRHVEKLVITK